MLIPEKYDYDEQKLINNIIESRKLGKKHHIIVNAEGIGNSQAMAKRIEAATGIETRATILGHMQRGGSPTCKDRVYASMMGAMAVDLLVAGKSCRVVGYRHGDFVDFDIDEALAMQKSVSEYQWEVCKYSTDHYPQLCGGNFCRRIFSLAPVLHRTGGKHFFCRCIIYGYYQRVCNRSGDSDHSYPLVDNRQSGYPFADPDRRHRSSISGKYTVYWTSQEDFPEEPEADQGVL